MNNINIDFDQKINSLNDRLEELVSLVDKKPNFYNNIFFEENNKSIPLNLINTDYINIEKNKEEKYFEKNIINEDYSKDNQNYLLKNPLYKFSLPSSDDSDNEDSNGMKHVSFKSICDEIIDTDFLEIIDLDNHDEKYRNAIKKVIKDNKIFPILMFKSNQDLPSINEIIIFIKKKIHIKPYEIKRAYLSSLNNYIFLIKFYSLNDAITSKIIFTNEFKINFHLCYDKREINDSKWYCVIFRRESIKDKNNYKFKDIINEIFEKINCKKKIITIDVNNDIFINEENINYNAIRVDNLNDALNLCLKYNNYNNLKVHLHYLTYQKSKKKLPKILLQKEYFKEKQSSFNEDPDSKIVKKLFGSLNKKRKIYKNES